MNDQYNDIYIEQMKLMYEKISPLLDLFQGRVALGFFILQSCEISLKKGVSVDQLNHMISQVYEKLESEKEEEDTCP